MSEATTTHVTGINPSGPAAAVLRALRANPGSTVADLAAHAHIGRSTASKVLTTVLEARGFAVRTPGGRDGKRRLPDIWNPAGDQAGDGDDPTGDTDARDQTDHADADQAADGTEPTVADETPATPSSETQVADDPEPGDGDGPGEAETGMAPDLGMLQAARAELAELGELALVAAAEIDAGQPLDGWQKAEVIKRKASRAHRTLQRAFLGRRDGRTSGGQGRRGHLRDLVAAFLADHPGTEYGPHQIAGELGRSSGAVANALDRLVALGHAVRTSDKPRRYTHTG